MKCTHGATVGQLDPDALFYLRARGIGKSEARAILLIRAFAGDIVGAHPVRAAPRALESWLLGAASRASGLTRRGLA